MVSALRVPPSAVRRGTHIESLIRPLRKLDNTSNWLYIAREYATMAAVLGVTIACFENRLPWAVLAPLGFVAMVLMAGCQHRLMGLGHEGAHYILFKNRLLNELASDLLCMFPVLATTEHYRQIHFGHHEFVNDWSRDPELLNLGEVRRMREFPMSRGDYVRSFGLWFLRPREFVRYLNDNLFTTILGMGRHPYMAPDDAASRGRFTPLRPATVLGVVYLGIMAASLTSLRYFGTPYQVALAACGLFAAAVAVISIMPRRWFFRSQLKSVYSTKVTSALRLGYFTLLYGSVAYAESVSGRPWGNYYVAFWLVPFVTVLPYIMIHRDLFQHANCDDGRMTNSRNMYTHPMLRWAMFVYGQDMHLTHHLCPAVPHYNLGKLDRVLREHDAEYADRAVECHGVFHRQRPDKPTILEAIEAEPT